MVQVDKMADMKTFNTILLSKTYNSTNNAYKPKQLVTSIL